MYFSSELAALAAIFAIASAQYCDPDLNDLCFVEENTADGITFRLAIPSGAEEGFRTALQIVAPVEIGWAGFSWGGAMTGVPLTLAWQNGQDNVTVSSRVTEVYDLPIANPDATITVLPGSGANDTHWKATVLCEGCSTWTKSGTDVAVDPSATSVPFAWALSEEAPAEPDDPDSSFGVHSATGFFSWSLLDAQTEDFDEVVGT